MFNPEKQRNPCFLRTSEVIQVNPLFVVRVFRWPPAKRQRGEIGDARTQGAFSQERKGTSIVDRVF